MKPKHFSITQVSSHIEDTLRPLTYSFAFGGVQLNLSQPSPSLRDGICSHHPLTSPALEGFITISLVIIKYFQVCHSHWLKGLNGQKEALLVFSNRAKREREKEWVWGCFPVGRQEFISNLFPLSFKRLNSSFLVCLFACLHYR